MAQAENGGGSPAREFVLIGNPVAHSLSPVMHNAVYAQLAAGDARFAGWHYERQLCETDEQALAQIGRLRAGECFGMNITMPYKPLALQQADFAAPEADAAGGANVLVARADGLHAHNTDGRGALGAVERVSGMRAAGKRVAVCGTGPTSLAIACAFANAGAAELVLLSREGARSRLGLERLRPSLAPGATSWLRAAEYGEAAGLIPSMDVVVDATPCGMHAGDAPVVPTRLLREGQVVLDTVYAHGTTALVAGAREAGALAMDGLEMLVEQAALSVEIWAEALGMNDVSVPRSVMRAAALGEA